MKKGSKHSKETIKKMSLLKIGKKLSKEHSENISKAIKGKPKPWQIGKRIFAIGTKFTDKHKKNLSESNQ